MLTAFGRAFKTPDLRRKMLFTLAIIAVYRLGAHVPTPGVSYPLVQQCIEGADNTNGLLGLVNLFSGGALLQLSIFALGIMPYITASIIVQLLTVVIPRFEALKKEGQAGQTQDDAVHALPDHRRWPSCSPRRSSPSRRTRSRCSTTRPARTSSATTRSSPSSSWCSR